MSNKPSLPLGWTVRAGAGSDYIVTKYGCHRVTVSARSTDPVAAALAALCRDLMDGDATLMDEGNKPVAWYDGNKFYGSQAAASMDMANMAVLAPLYTHPPQRQPLTDERVTAAARVLNDRSAESCGTDKDDQWKLFGEYFKCDALAMLEAAHGIGGEA